MNSIDLSKPEKVVIAQDSIILKVSLLGCLGLGLIGSFVFIMSGLKEAPPQATGKPDKVIISQTQSNPPLIVTKEPSKPVIIEEGSEAWFCIQNNGGDSCLTRDRFAPNYQVVSREKTYEDRLVECGIRPMNTNNCPPEIAWQPNCQY